MNVKYACFGLVLGDEKLIKAAGYDVAEFQVLRVMEPDDFAYGELKKRFADTGLEYHVFDNPIPLTEVICDPGFDLDVWREFLLKAAERCSGLGCDKFVFGNGKTRSLPEQGDIEAAKGKLDKFIDMMCDISAQFGITVLLEPLGRSFSNTFNTVEDCANAIGYYGKKNLSMLIDLRHIVALELPMSEIVKYREHVLHVHVDYPYSTIPQRFSPSAADGFDYAPFFSALGEIGYTGNISIEANQYGNYGEDIKPGLQFVKSLVAAAQARA